MASELVVCADGALLTERAAMLGLPSRFSLTRLMSPLRRSPLGTDPVPVSLRAPAIPGQLTVKMALRGRDAGASV